MEALSLPVSPLVESHPEYLISRGEKTFFIQYSLTQDTLSFSYTLEWKKRKYAIGSKATTKQNLRSRYPHVVSFHPQAMNLMYLGPSERRLFLDELLSQCYPIYRTHLQKYKKIVQHRNKVLKNISDQKSSVSELEFWNEKFISSALEIYKYRKKFVRFLESRAQSLNKFLFGKVETISFEYISHINLDTIESSLKEATQQLQSREILLRKTLRWPHLDDFNIILDWVPLIHYASRGEVKSILLGLKFLETQYLQEQAAEKEIIFIVDDILSELDASHRDLLLEHIDSRQSIISCIEDPWIEWNKIYI